MILNPENARNFRFSTLQPKSLFCAALSSEENKEESWTSTGKEKSLSLQVVATSFPKIYI